jgi:hypothetical protein
MFSTGDAAYPLKNRVMSLYYKRELSAKEAAFNFRLTWARRSVEWAFGM